MVNTAATPRRKWGQSEKGVWTRRTEGFCRLILTQPTRSRDTNLWQWNINTMGTHRQKQLVQCKHQFKGSAVSLSLIIYLIISWKRKHIGSALTEVLRYSSKVKAVTDANFPGPPAAGCQNPWSHICFLLELERTLLCWNLLTEKR